MPRTAEDDIAIRISNLNFWYGENKALEDINVEIPRKRITAIIGPSGCGKSTMLFCMNRMFDGIAGAKAEGKIEIGSRNILGKNINLIDLRRKVGMIFQKPTVFPFSIRENVTYGLKAAGIRDEDLLERSMLASLKKAALHDELKDRLDEPAENLSGGQQQRLCIARAIAMRPNVLLMDEPCSALDPIATMKIEDLMRGLREEFAVVIVTHNMQQAARVSDMTAFMWLGKLVEFGETERIFTNPSDPKTVSYVTGRVG
ncbi:MAG: phosphate ABC transporter ATP-binding protein PstB [Euryarchaeota archaeon]|nr:phosphate ABC transporter ATP-binding protein PstB [Euryarchaeota archaeon]